MTTLYAGTLELQLILVTQPVLLQDLSAKTIRVSPMQSCTRANLQKVPLRREASREAGCTQAGETDRLCVRKIRNVIATERKIHGYLTKK